MTRIIGGSLGGRTIRTPAGETTRPTSMRIRGALANSLQASGFLAGASVLDLYAGSGALGLELLSRGAARVTFVENDRHAVEALRRTLAELAAAVSAATVLAEDVRSAIARLATGTDRFDIVVADPPYAVDNAALADVLDALPPILTPGADVVVERGRRSGEVPWPPPLVAVRTKRHGDTLLCYGRLP